MQTKDGPGKRSRENPGARAYPRFCKEIRVFEKR